MSVPEIKCAVCGSARWLIDLSADKIECAKCGAEPLVDDKLRRRVCFDFSTGQLVVEDERAG